MKKYLSIVFSLFVLFAFAKCTSDDEQLKNNLNAVRTLSVVASMPGDGSDTKTRVVLSETDEGNINVKWEDGDKVNLCFVSGDGANVKTVSDVLVTNISEDGKRAEFEVAIPDDISGTFSLYGVYGATFATDNSSTVLLPDVGEEIELSAIESVSVMRFAAENISETSTVQVPFSHIGSIIALWVTNEASSSIPISHFTLGSSYAGSTISPVNWLNNISEQATYDIKTGNFDYAKAGNSITFTPPEDTYLPSQNMAKYYHWVIPIDEDNMDEQPDKFYVQYHDGTINRVAELPARKLLPGKYYRIHLMFDDEFKYRKPVTDSDLVGYWPFDGNANDVVGENHGTVFGNVSLTTDRHGNANSAYQFDGKSGDYIKCPLPGVLGTQARTISFWAKADALTSSLQVIIAYGGSTLGYGTRFEVSLLTGELMCDISSSNYARKSSDIVNDVWNFYTVVFMGGSNQNLATGVRYYVNGVLLLEKGTNTGSNTVNTAANNPIYFGSLYNSQRWFKGAIDDVRLYDKALNSMEVLELYQRD